LTERPTRIAGFAPLVFALVFCGVGIRHWHT
jgi:hypothetical protein